MDATTVGIVTPITDDASSTKFMWEISDLSLNSSKQSKYCKRPDFFKSPKFTTDAAIANNIQWQLHFYSNETISCNAFYEPHDSRYIPGGNNVYHYSKKMCAFYLFANDIMQPVTSFKICNARFIEVIHETHKQIGDWEYVKLTPQHHLLNTGYGVLNSDDDKFTIICELTCSEAYQEMQQGDVRLQLQIEYEALLTSSKFSDVSLIAEGKPLKLHKCILAGRSSVFAAMFDADMREKQENSVEITDINYDVLVEMVRFIYAGKINNIDTLAGELAVAADKYALDALKIMCEKAMRKNLSLDNVISCAQLAESLRMDSLKESAIEFMIKNASVISDKPEFNLLPHDILHKIVHCLAENQK